MENKYELVRERIIKKIDEDSQVRAHAIISWDKDSLQFGDVDFERFFHDEKYIPHYSYKCIVGLHCLMEYDENNDQLYKGTIL